MANLHRVMNITMLPAKRIARIMLLVLVPGATPTMVQAALPAMMPAPTGNDAAHYRSCLAAADSDPKTALNEALKWANAGGGLPAQHCAALALVGVGRYGEAASRLDALARAKNVPGVAFRATLFDQAGNAWLLDGNGAKAITSLTSALALSGGDPDLFADLARAQAMRKNWREADMNLTQALQMDPGRPDLLVLRASARRALGELKPAWADLNKALALRPGDGNALLERGLLRKQVGDMGGARRDFQAALKAARSTATQDAARENLDALSE